MKKSLPLIVLVIMFCAGAPFIAFAVDTGPSTGVTNVDTGPSTGDSGSLLNPLGTTDLEALVLKILKFIIRIGAIVVIFMLVYVGFLFVRARGEPAALTTARQALLWTVVGALILLGSQ